MSNNSSANGPTHRTQDIIRSEVAITTRGCGGGKQQKGGPDVTHVGAFFVWYVGSSTVLQAYYILQRVLQEPYERYVAENAVLGIS